MEFSGRIFGSSLEPWEGQSHPGFCHRSGPLRKSALTLLTLDPILPPTTVQTSTQSQKIICNSFVLLVSRSGFKVLILSILAARSYTHAIAIKGAKGNIGPLFCLQVSCQKRHLFSFIHLQWWGNDEQNFQKFYIQIICCFSSDCLT